MYRDASRIARITLLQRLLEAAQYPTCPPYRLHSDRLISRFLSGPVPMAIHSLKGRSGILIAGSLAWFWNHARTCLGTAATGPFHT